jgi:hypothetical protein
MPDPHAPPDSAHVTSDGPPPPHGVAYEPSDVKPRGVVIFGVSLVVAGIVIQLALWGLFVLFARREPPGRERELPPAVADKPGQLPPEPRLEAVDDLKRGKVDLWPPRAQRFLGPEEKRLEEGGGGAIPIDQAIAALAGKLPARKGSPAPETYLRRLPSKAASGRAETGGQ